MEAVFGFVVFMFIGAGCFAAGYIAHDKARMFRKEWKKVQQPPRPHVTVTLDSAKPKWTSRVAKTDPLMSLHFDVMGEVSNGTRVVRVVEGSVNPRHTFIYNRDTITVPVSNVDEIILAMKSAQLATLQGPED